MEDSHKPHRAPHSGSKADKKKAKKNGTTSKKGNNPRAFTMSNSRRAEKIARRSTEMAEKRLHVPMVDRTPEEPPPVVVAVVGPPGVGKTTLIKSLVRHYSKHALTQVTGPITVVSGKHRRLTFIECPNDLNSMIDIAKAADLTLLLIDASFGFEMETMEYLNILSSHGMSRIFGVLTHLDLIKKAATVRAVKKRLKHRFWTEIYDGAKLFYLSGVLNGRYPDREILNLSRFISVLKFRPLKWKMSHPYVLADRMEELTPPQDIEENPICDRTITLYGYLRGTNLSANEPKVHIPGVGDFTVSQVTGLIDPCPSPGAVAKERGTEGGKIKRRSLNDKQKLIYAPMSDVGGIMFDKDAVYITVPDNQSFTRREDGEEDEDAGVGERLVMKLQERRNGLGETGKGLQLFSEGQEITTLTVHDANGDTGRKERRRPASQANGANLEAWQDEDDDGDDDEDDSNDDDNDEILDSVDLDNDDIQIQQGSSDEDEDLVFAESDSDMGEPDSDEEIPSSMKWKENLSQKASALYSGSRHIDLNRLIYSDEPVENIVRTWREYIGAHTPNDEDDDIEEDDDAFFKKAPEENQLSNDGSLPHYPLDRLSEWKNQDKINSLRHRFITSNMLEEGQDQEAEAFGDFEDLENGDSQGADEEPEQPLDLEAERAANAKRKEELRLRFEEAEENQNQSDSEQGEQTWGDQQKAKIQKQLEINKREFEGLDAESRVKVEGHLPGTYVRMVLHGIPYEFIERFDPRFPIILGGLLNDEQRFGFIQTRMKRHRWHKRILKTNDPLVFSLGWRRFQSIPIYSTSDSRIRNRMLKYTPEHMHCFATFYGPLTAANTGFCAVQSVSQKDAAGSSFRIAATGVVLDIDSSTEIVKKLKLTGTPMKVFKNTAFVRDMFTSAIEVAKFEGVHIRTVSGIKGQIKKALRKPDGAFRATFEDKVLMSDIIFLRAWYPIRPRKFYNPVTSLLEEDKMGWRGMRTTGKIRAELGIAAPSDPDSTYRKIERPIRRFNPLRVPKALQASLPFASKPLYMKKQKKQTYLQKRAVVLGGDEKRARDLLQKVITLRNEKIRKRKEKKAIEWEKHLKKVHTSENLKKAREKREKKEFWEKEGRKRKIDAEGSQGSKKRRQ